MRTLFTRLWNDKVGSSVSAEMGLVTSVTIGALFMGMSQFGASVNQSFQNTAVTADMMTAEELEVEERRKEFLEAKHKRQLETKNRLEARRSVLEQSYAPEVVEE